MGLYDRDYYRDDGPRGGGVSDWSAVMTLIVINVVVFVADIFSDNHWVWVHLGLPSDLLQHPWEFWKLLTSGFIHDPSSLMHILFNMLGLWIFGPAVESIYGKRRFLELYLSLVVLSAAAWLGLHLLLSPRHPAFEFGASGAVMGIMMLYILHFPHNTIVLFYVIPMPAWVAGIVFVVIDVGGLTGSFRFMEQGVANSAHLAGMFFGYVYYKTHWTLFSLWPGGWLKGFKRRKYRVYRGDRDDGHDKRPLQQQVDDILAKITREGESSLTAAERRTLEEASRKYRSQGPGR